MSGKPSLRQKLQEIMHSRRVPLFERMGTVLNSMATLTFFGGTCGRYMQIHWQEDVCLLWGLQLHYNLLNGHWERSWSLSCLSLALASLLLCWGDNWLCIYICVLNVCNDDRVLYLRIMWALTYNESTLPRCIIIIRITWPWYMTSVKVVVALWLLCTLVIRL